MSYHNLNIDSIQNMISPKSLFSDVPSDDEITSFVKKAREQVANIVNGKDSRLLCIVGPCSIHDPKSSLEYATELKKMHDKFSDNLFIIMRVYFEKPRTRTGWKGFINDPDLDGSLNVNKGLTNARRLLLEINKLGLPAGCEFLDTITPQYFSDLVSWGAIGARTTQSQVHRQLVSGLSMPIGFKNGTDGNFKIAIDGIISASSSHTFPGVTIEGTCSLFVTKGNENCHIILRGGEKPNYHEEDIKEINDICQKEGLKKRIIIDCSHGNSQKDHKRQPIVSHSISKQVSNGAPYIGGVMIESHIKEGKQALQCLKKLEYGISITDACVDLVTTYRMLKELNDAIAKSLEFKKVSSLGRLAKEEESPIMDELSYFRNQIEAYDKYIFIMHFKNTSFLKYCNIPDLESDMYTHSVTGIKTNIDKLINESTHDFSYDPEFRTYLNHRIYLGKYIAECKFKMSPMSFLRRFEDFDKEVFELITKRDVELKKIKTRTEKHSPKKMIDFFETIFFLTKTVQIEYLKKRIADIKIGYLGGMGTFSHEATKKLSTKVKLVPFPSFENMLENKSNVQFLLVPIYNNIKGTIKLGFDLSGMVGTIEQHIHLDLLSTKNIKPKELTKIYSHPVAFEEASRWLREQCLDVKLIETPSTLEACKMAIKDEENSAVLCSKACRSIFLNSIINGEISDSNYTTFGLLKVE